MVKQIILKIVTAGEGGTGKTTLLHRYVNNFFNDDLKMTIGIEFFVKTIIHNGQNYTLQLWDFGGQERFRFMMPSYIMGTKGALLMVDLTRMLTLNKIGEWIDLLRTHDANLPILLIGTKLDLNYKISVEDDDVQPLLEKYQLSGYLKLSSKTGENVEHAFNTLLEKIVLRA